MSITSTQTRVFEQTAGRVGTMAEEEAAMAFEEEADDLGLADKEPADGVDAYGEEDEIAASGGGLFSRFAPTQSARLQKLGRELLTGLRESGCAWHTCSH